MHLLNINFILVALFMFKFDKSKFFIDVQLENIDSIFATFSVFNEMHLDLLMISNNKTYGSYY